MSANGTFDVDLTPQEDVGSSSGADANQENLPGRHERLRHRSDDQQRTENGTAVYYAIEEFSGSVDGKSGGFTLVHKGHMSKDVSVTRGHDS